MTTMTDVRATRTDVRPRVLIVDDQTLFRSGLAKLLEADERIEVTGQAADGEEAVQQAAKLRPDVVLMDLKMPKLDGVEATRKITSENPGTRVLILTTFDAENHFIQALKAGARGYVLKDSEPDAIVSAILAVVSGESVMATPVADKVLEMLTGNVTPKAGNIASRSSTGISGPFNLRFTTVTLPCVSKVPVRCATALPMETSHCEM